MSEEERELHFGDTLPSIPDWDDEWDDWVTKLVFIGIDMDRAEIERTLDETLLTEEEMLMNWRELKDPFPAWS
ncbi:GTP-binding protein [Paenibacillus xylanexedens]|uniref:GTP-binding protein n=1 Tax=Paenibacillus xylanexedens TaxID=528191 RepID=UPI003D064907